MNAKFLVFKNYLPFQEPRNFQKMNLSSSFYSLKFPKKKTAPPATKRRPRDWFWSSFLLLKETFSLRRWKLVVKSSPSILCQASIAQIWAGSLSTFWGHQKTYRRTIPRLVANQQLFDQHTSKYFYSTFLINQILSSLISLQIWCS